MKKSLLISILFLVQIPLSSLFAQQNKKEIIFHITSKHTSFPDSGRKNGHIYENKLFSAREHYNDSSVLIIVPGNLNVKKKIDLVYWFHGWGNHIDSAAKRYELTSQFLGSNCNAILILPETAYNAPDSYGGKLENAGEFEALTADILNTLKDRKIIEKNCEPGHIVLAGHSGAYRVIARIILNGHLAIDEILLFDALYSQTEIYLNWLKADSKHRFIHIATNYGEGPLEESKRMTQLLDKEAIPYIQLEESALTSAALQKNNILFIHSHKEHNEIVNQDNFKLLLQSSPFIKGF